MLPLQPYQRPMHRRQIHHSPLFWAGICVLLLAGVGYCGWLIWHHPPNVIAVTQADSPGIPVGVPNVPSREEKLIDAASAVLIDTRDNRIMFQQNAFEQ